MTVTEEFEAVVSARLDEVRGVERVLVDGTRREAWLVLRGDTEADIAEAEARRILAQLQAERAAGSGGDDAEWHVCTVFRQGLRERQRVRFVSLEREVLPDQQVTFVVRLEWQQEEYVGRATGEQSGAIELRSVASAALDAIAALVPDDLHVRLTGVKQVRAFDAELIVVSLLRPDTAPHNLVGAVVAGEDPRRATALCVLNALNRLMGNYLALP